MARGALPAVRMVALAALCVSGRAVEGTLEEIERRRAAGR